MKFTLSAFALLLSLASVTTTPAYAQGGAGGTTTGPWSVDVNIGWDNSISGDFVTGAIGTYDGRPISVNRLGWDDVYGTGLFFNATVGRAWGQFGEWRGGFTWQTTGAKDTQLAGTLNGQPLTMSFEDYNTWALDFGYRQYFAERVERWRPYVGGTVGFGQVSDIDAAFTAGSLIARDTRFYEGNGTFVLGVNGGVLYRFTEQLAIDGRLGLRYTSGLSNVDTASFTGLDDANDGSSRWTLPLTVGLRFQF